MLASVVGRVLTSLAAWAFEWGYESLAAWAFERGYDQIARRYRQCNRCSLTAAQDCSTAGAIPLGLAQWVRPGDHCAGHVPSGVSGTGGTAP
jgi:hypothetical protein